MVLPSLSEEYASFFLIGGSTVAGYAAVRGLTDALLPRDRPAPLVRAIVHALMTAIVAVAAVLRYPALLDIAVGVPFSAAVSAITLALGVVHFVALPQSRFWSAPDSPDSPPDSARSVGAVGSNSRRAWAFLLPTGLLTLLIGFSGQLTPGASLMLAAEGAAIALVTAGPRVRPVLTISAGAGGDEAGAAETLPRPTRLVLAQALLAVSLMLIAGWGLVQGAAGLALHNPAFRPGVAAVIALGPAMVLPMIPPLATLAERGRRDEATSTIVGFALINLCVVLPLVVVARQLTLLAAGAVSATTQPATPAELPFPILVWRLDTVLLSTVGLLLLPAAIGRWTLSRAEGLGLVCVYVTYLFLTLLISHG